jgi:hypothetical protein
VQQIGMGDYRPDLPGLEVVLLDRLRTEALGLESNNLFVDRQGNLLWAEDRPYDSGWLTVTENLNNWNGTGADLDTTAWIYANGGCDLDAPPRQPSIPQQYRLYNWSIYTGWITPDFTLYTPGSAR